MPYLRPLIILAIFFLLAVYLWVGFFLGAFIMYLDIRARHKDWLRIKGTKFSSFRAKELGKSWCGRGVCEFEWPEAKVYFYQRGYRWYHILPDGFPLVFLKINFWKSVIGWV